MTLLITDIAAKIERAKSVDELESCVSYCEKRIADAEAMPWPALAASWAANKARAQDRLRELGPRFTLPHFR